jgi:hypothetical protein
VASANGSKHGSRLGPDQGNLHFDIPAMLRAGGPFVLAVDGEVVEPDLHHDELVRLKIGPHDVVLRDGVGRHCRAHAMVEAGRVTEFDWCTNWGDDAPLPAELHVPPGPPLDFTFDHVELRDVVWSMAERCGWNMVSGDLIDPFEGKVSAKLQRVPCDQAIANILAAHGFAYEYVPGANLVRVMPVRERDQEVAAAGARRALHVTDDPLPMGSKIDLDYKNAPLREVVNTLAVAGGVNVIMPESVGDNVRVTVQLKRVPWAVAVQQILASEDLWYRYSENGKILRLAMRKDLDAEDAAARARAHANMP